MSQKQLFNFVCVCVCVSMSPSYQLFLLKEYFRKLLIWESERTSLISCLQLWVSQTSLLLYDLSFWLLSFLQPFLMLLPGRFTGNGLFETQVLGLWEQEHFKLSDSFCKGSFCSPDHPATLLHLIPVEFPKHIRVAYHVSGEGLRSARCTSVHVLLVVGDTTPVHLGWKWFP